MKKKKSLIAIIGALLVVVVGVTFAYFTSSATFNNRFNLGYYQILSTEVFESPANWAPGDTTPKTITTTNEGSIDAAVRISYTETWTDSNGDPVDSSNIPNDAVIINFRTPSDWTENNGYYYYNYILEPQKTTSSLIESVTLNPNLNGTTCTESNGVKTCTSNLQGLAGYHYTLTFTIETVQFDQYQNIWNTNVEIVEKSIAIKYLSRQVEGQITPGDKVGIGETEDFYVLSSNTNKTILLAKYNLLVGEYISINTDDNGTLDSSIAGYGLQSEDAYGYNLDFDPGYNAIMNFASSNYWLNNRNLISPYNENDTIYFDFQTYSYKYRSDDSPAYPHIYNENSILYQYISGPNGYIDKLKEMGAPSTITGRILTYEEIINYQNIKDEGVSIIFDGKQDYWIDPPPYGIDSNDNEITYYHYYGVRPVIEIPTSEIN